MPADRPPSLAALDPVVPVIRTASTAEAATTAEWLVEAGFRALELTLTTPGALDLIAQRSGRPGLLVGAGTVLTAGEAEAALKAGARFLVTPCWVDGVVERGSEAGVPTLIGAATPSEIWRAHNAGATAVKIFPIVALGGPGFLRQVRAVFPGIAMLPTGGITPETARDYLAAGAIAVGIGSELAPAEAVRRGDRAAVLAAARRALALVAPGPGGP